MHHTGVLLGKFACFVPQGMVVFFPSYKTMKDYTDKWKNHGNGVINNILQKHKSIFIESKSDKRQFVSDWKKFSQICSGGGEHGFNSPQNGAIYFAVANGKLSEGIDFTDGMARLVVMVGVPNKNTYQSSTQEKMKFLDRIIKELNAKNDPLYFDGSEWYQNETNKSVNQAIGRVIRHKYDFGGIVLLDSRYKWDKNKSGISHWMKNEIIQTENDGQCEQILKNFYTNAKKYCSEQKAAYESLRSKDEASLIKVEDLKRQFNDKKNKPNSNDENDYHGIKYDQDEDEQVEEPYKFKRTQQNHISMSIGTHQDSETKDKLSIFSNFAQVNFGMNDEDIIMKDTKNLLDLDFMVKKMEKNLQQKKEERNLMSVENIIQSSNPENKKNLTRSNNHKLFESNQSCYIKDFDKKLDKNGEYQLTIQDEKNLQCMICLKNSIVIFEHLKAGKCGHVACDSCWGQWLEKKLECPFCTIQVRYKKLVNIVRPQIKILDKRPKFI